MGEVRLPQDLASVVARRLAERTGEFAVIGLGRSGRAVAHLLRAAGIAVYASDASASDATLVAAYGLSGRSGASSFTGERSAMP